MGLERTVEGLNSLYSSAGFTFGEDSDKHIVVGWAYDSEDILTTWSYRISRDDDRITSQLTAEKQNKTNGKEERLYISFSSQYHGPIIYSEDKNIENVFEQGRCDIPRIAGFYKDDNKKIHYFFGSSTANATAFLKSVEEQLMNKIPDYFVLQGCVPAAQLYTSLELVLDDFLQNSNLFK